MLCDITFLNVILTVTRKIERLSLLFVPSTEWRRNGDYYEEKKDQTIMSVDYASLRNNFMC